MRKSTFFKLWMTIRQNVLMMQIYIYTLTFEKLLSATYVQLLCYQDVGSGSKSSCISPTTFPTLHPLESGNSTLPLYIKNGDFCFLPHSSCATCADDSLVRPHWLDCNYYTSHLPQPFTWHTFLLSAIIIGVQEPTMVSVPYQNTPVLPGNRTRDILNMSQAR